jgi:transcriptional regulator with XRE-family HTH domain
MIMLGNTARHLRVSMGLTQRAAAQKLQVSVVHLCNVENNKSAPSADLLRRYRELWSIDLYVLAWCLHGDTDRLPAAVRKPMRELAKAWKRQLAEKNRMNRKEARSQCSRSAK